MKLVVVGGVAGGASAAARVRRLDGSAEIVVFERGADVSYSNCALPYYLGGLVETADQLILSTPEKFRNQHDIDVRVHSEVTAIDRDRKTVSVKNVLTGETYEEAYDKLVLSPGASPIMPRSIRGIDRENVFSVRNVQDIVGIKTYLDAHGAKDVVVTGGGFIGIEVAENLKNSGRSVTVVEGLGQILAPFDLDMVQILQKELYDNGVRLELNSTLMAIEDGQAVCAKDGAEFTVPADAVILSIGVSPETKLAVEAGLSVGQTRGIRVNEHMQTDDPDIYAVGDAVEIRNLLTGQPGRLALAGPAQWQARAAADHICGLDSVYKGFIGSSCIRVFGLNAASTGLNERAAAAVGLAFDFVTVYPYDKVKIMPDSSPLAFKMVYSVPDGKILGAQAIGKGDATKRVDIIASLIHMGATVYDLLEVEHCYAPLFSTAKDVVHMAALTAENLLAGRFRQVHVGEVRGLVESGATVIDVREAWEYELSHVKGAKNIPLSELRAHLDEIPKEGPVYVHCRTSQRSYYACCYLRDLGFGNVINLSGSFLGICLHEYFNDQTTGREPIVTGYNFE